MARFCRAAYRYLTDNPNRAGVYHPCVPPPRGRTTYTSSETTAEVLRYPGRTGAVVRRGLLLNREIPRRPRDKGHTDAAGNTDADVSRRVIARRRIFNWEEDLEFRCGGPLELCAERIDCGCGSGVNGGLISREREKFRVWFF